MHLSSPNGDDYCFLILVGNPTHACGVFDALFCDVWLCVFVSDFMHGVAACMLAWVSCVCHVAASVRAAFARHLICLWLISFCCLRLQYSLLPHVCRRRPHMYIVIYCPICVRRRPHMYSLSTCLDQHLLWSVLFAFSLHTIVVCLN